jgi:hypothetical protein
MVVEGSAKFEATLLAKSGDLKDLEGPRSLLVTALAGVYPFRATRLTIETNVRSEGNDVYVSLNLRLPRGLVAYAGTFKGVKSHYMDGEHRKGFLAYSTWQEGKDSADAQLGLTYRFKPFVAFRMAVLPISVIYAASLLTVGISIAGVSIYAEPSLARLALLAANASLFTAVAEIQTGLGTRSLMGELKVTAWTFIALTVLQVTYPDALKLLGFNIFDLILKGTDLWVIAAVVISAFVYPFISEQRKLDSIISLIVLIVVVVAIARFLILPPMSLAEALFRLRL